MSWQNATEPPTLIGAWTLLEPIGRGADGVVYRAQRATGELAALKTVRAPDPPRLASLRREIHALASLRHPGVVRILEHGVHEGLPWYAMELIEGRTLRDYARAQWDPAAAVASATASAASAASAPAVTSAASSSPPPVPPHALRRILTVVARACAPLAYIHGEGVVHRDLKPGNIIVRADDSPVLVDFGLVAHFGGEESREALEPGGDVVGTYAYVAPEQLRGELVDARADLYALGAVLYALLAGRPVFSSIEDILSLTVEPQSLSRWVTLPEGLEALVMRLLTRAPAGRPGYTEDVARELVAFGADPLEAGPAPRTYLYRPGFTGREAALSAIGQHFVAGLRNGGGAIALVGGESGLGKTRLAMEVGAGLRSRGVLVVTGEGLPASPGMAGSPGMALFRPVLGLLADRCRAATLEERRLLLGRHAAVLAAYEPALATLMEAGRLELSDLPPDEARRRVFAALLEALVVLAGSSPMLLVLDDLQWADELSLEFLLYLEQVGAFLRVRLLVLGLFRIEEGHEGLRALMKSGRALVLELERLPDEAVGTMVRNMLALSSPPGAFVEALARHAEGVPFFVAEYLRTAVAEGLLRRDGKHGWQVAGGGGGEAGEEGAAGVEGAAGEGGAVGEEGAAGVGGAVPDTRADADLGSRATALPLPRSIRALVARRLAGLSEAARQLVQAGAVLGRELDGALLIDTAASSRALLAALVDDDLERTGPGHPLPRGGTIQDDWLEASRELLSRAVLEEVSPHQFRFVHDKIREVAYDEIAPLERPRLHRAAAECLEQLDLTARETHWPALGDHWARAGVLDRARASYLEGARRAVLRYAHDEAERCYRAFLELEGATVGERIAVCMALAEKVLERRGRNREALAMYRGVVEEAGASGDVGAQIAALCALSHVQTLTADFDGALARSTEAFELARSHADRIGEGRALVRIAHALHEQAQLDQARKALDQALELLEGASDRDAFEALGRLAGLHWNQGRPLEARELCLRQLAVARELRERSREGECLLRLGLIEWARSEFAAARVFYQEALEVTREIGDRRTEGLALGHLGGVALNSGRLAEARDCCERAVAIHREVGNRRSEGETLSNLAVALHQAGELEAAERVLHTSLKLHRETKNLRLEGAVLGWLGALRGEQGRVEEARTLLKQSLTLLEAAGDRLHQAGALLNLATLERREGVSLELAARLVEESERLNRSVQHSAGIAESLCERGQLALAAGRSAGEWIEQVEALLPAGRYGSQSSVMRALERLRQAESRWSAGASILPPPG